MENFVQTHLHTIYSIYDGCSTPEDMVEQAVAHGHQACAITDHGSMSGTYLFQQAALKTGVKPLIGMEGYVVDKLVDEENGKRIRRKNNHIVMIAKNEKGWKNLLNLNYLSNSDEHHYYYKPRFTFKELFDHKEGIIVSSACLASGFSNLLKLGKEDEAEKLFERFCSEFGEDFYAELQLNEIKEQKDYNSWLISQATHYGVPLTITGDCHYATPDGFSTQEMAFRVRSDDENEVGQTFECRKLYYHGISDYKMFNSAWNYGYTDSFIESCCANTVDLANKVDFLIPERTRMRLPRQAFDEDLVLIQEAKRGLCEYFGVENFEDCPKEYKDRFNSEIKLMVRKGIARYFLVLKDIVEWCDENGVSRGVSRGSAGGSLVSMCLGVTGKAMDPVKQHLLFERFISDDRLVDCCIDYSKTNN